MKKRIFLFRIIVPVLALLLLIECGGIIKENSVYAAISGNGKSGNPYIATNHDELEYALTGGKRKNATTYIEIKGKIEIKKNIDIDGGSFEINANGNGAKLVKSTNFSDKINNPTNPTYCFRIGINSTTNVNIGCMGDELTLGGQRSTFEDKKKVTSGWMYIGSKGSVVLGSSTVAKNMLNNDADSQLSNFTVFGNLTVDCTITNCTAANGGAICAKGNGTVTLEQHANINKCTAQTEGGALWIKENAVLLMNGGSVTENSSGQEGGGIFVSGANVVAKIQGGYISSNASGQSAGGIFAGYGATLIIGKVGTSGPVISKNSAEGSGGGIRANGGTTSNAGGSLTIYSGVIEKNTSGKYGGGIGIGEPGDKGIGYVNIQNAIVKGNIAIRGGGIYLSKKNQGSNGEVEISNSQIDGNSAGEYGGGIFNAASLKLTKTIVKSNSAAGCGGGIHIADGSSVVSTDGVVDGNTAKNGGSGIYLNGIVKVGGSFVLKDNNEIFICKNKYVEVNVPFTYAASKYFNVNSEVKENGTKLIYVSHANGTGESLLYCNTNGEEQEYTNRSIPKYVSHIGLSKDQLLRSSGHITYLDGKWIFISEAYEINYIMGVDKGVYNAPKNQVKFYDETTTITSTIPDRDEYEADMKKIWNSKQDGSGYIYLPGSLYSSNADITLYVIWKKKLIISIEATDRYYLVGQKVELNEEEIFKKVKVTDNLNTGYNYKIEVINIQDKTTPKQLLNNMAGLGKDKLSKYLTTEKARTYELKLYVSNSDYDKEQTQTMRVYVLAEEPRADRVRFISRKYIYTLDENSIWNRGNNKSILNDRLGNTVVKKFELSSSKLDDMKKYIKQESYSETKSANSEFYDKFLRKGNGK